jgi:acetyl-CoA C-acetyltransferase
MASRGLREPIAIIGMGCTNFGERWDKSIDDLLVEAVTGAVGTVDGLDLAEVDAFWLGTHGSGFSGLALSKPLKIENKAVTRIENMCATGSDAFRNACYAVAAGAYDVVIAAGVEKLKDSGFSGLAIPGLPSDGTAAELTAPGMYALLVPAYSRKYGVDPETMKEVLTHIAWKNHRNGALNPRAQFQKEVSKDVIRNAPTIAGMLGLYDCSGIADGAAAAVICRAEDAHRYTRNAVYVRGLALAAGSGMGTRDERYDFTTFPEAVRSSQDAYAQAGITDPANEISMAEVHDCFTPTELVLMEDLGLSPRGQGWKDVLAGSFDLDGRLPVNPDGGLKSFGHPVGASGLRMLFELWLQFRGEAGPRQLKDPKFGLVQNQGGTPGEIVSYVSVIAGTPG